MLSDWWTWTGSNRRPLPCHGSALPTAPQAPECAATPRSAVSNATIASLYTRLQRYTVLMDRTQAWDIVCEFVKSESLRKHMLAVETCVAAYARKFREEGQETDEEKWAITALLHDFDLEI